MTNPRLRPALLLSALVGLVGTACNSTSSPSYDSYAAQVVRADCESIFNCCDQSRIAQTSSEFTDVESCVRYRMSNHTFRVPSAYRYDADVAGRCLADHKSGRADCSSQSLISNGFDSCPEAFIGQLALGADCSLSEGDDLLANPCVAGAVCVGLAGADHPTCVTAQPAGARCDTMPCADDLRCGSDQICAKPKPAGATCNGNNFECDDVNCKGGVCTDPPASFWICYYDPS